MGSVILGETSSLGLYSVTSGALTEDPASPGLYLLAPSTFTEDPASPGLYFVSESDFTDDLSIWPQLLTLKACLEAELTKRNLFPACYVHLFPGTVPDYSGKKDIAFIMLGSAFPTSGFPLADPFGKAGSRLAASVSIAVVRCIKVTANPLPAAEQLEYVRLQMADMAAMREAVRCCTDLKDRALGAYTPLGPEGGLYGGSWEVFVGDSGT